VSTALMLVVLRLTIGWHFYTEGAKHLAEPHWSSEGFLRQAKGPLASKYKSVLPRSDYGLDAALHSATVSKPMTDAEAAADIKKTVDQWKAEVTDELKAARTAFNKHYQLDDEQKAEGDKIAQRHESQLSAWIAEHQAELAEHIHNWQRLTKSRLSKSANDVPFEKKRIDEALAKLNAEASAWLAQLRSNEQSLRAELERTLKPDQSGSGGVAEDRATLESVDRVMKYGIVAVGGCLILGLFARLASLLGAVFLASIVLSQPPWLRDAAPTYPQLLEMLALLTLATVPVGRWCGLDFFLHYLFGRSRRKAIDEPHS
jgi:uncharacterized membrane protein YphA (DoxX/SURF4 family)